MARKRKGVSIRSIGAEIRKKQAELRGKKRKASPKAQKAIDLKIRRLETVRSSVKAFCKGNWLLPV
jgi:hypothetical protein